eukprot:jgi/Pico_ML_1/51447/g2476.t1
MIYDVQSYLFQSFLTHHGGQKIPELKNPYQDQGKAAEHRQREDKENVVLVPPLYERFEKGQARFCKPAYPYLFGKPFRQWLFEDYIRVENVQARLRLQPPDDKRVQKWEWVDVVDQAWQKPEGASSIPNPV